MTRSHRTRARLLAAGLAAVLTSGLVTILGGAAAAGSTNAVGQRRAAPVVKLELNKLEQGAPPAVPFMTSDGRLVDGDTDIQVKGRSTTLLGEYDDTYVYARSSRQGSFKEVLRVAADGTTTTVTSAKGADGAVLSDDGTTLAVLTSGKKRSDLKVVDVATGADRAETSLKLSWLHLLDVDADRVLLGGWNQQRTYSWAIGTQVLDVVKRKVGYDADIGADRLAILTKDPYLGGCSVVSTLARPGQALTKSCDERVEEFSPDGSHTANVHLLTDGLGPNRVTTRTASGKKVATYDAPYYFGQVLWEDADTVFFHVYSKKRSALVRCTVGDCEIAVPDLGKPVARAVAPRATWSPR